MLLVAGDLSAAGVDLEDALVAVVLVNEAGPLLEGVEVGALLDGIGGDLAGGVDVVLELSNSLSEVIGKATGGGLSLVLLGDLIDNGDHLLAGGGVVGGNSLEVVEVHNVVLLGKPGGEAGGDLRAVEGVELGVDVPAGLLTEGVGAAAGEDIEAVILGELVGTDALNVLHLSLDVLLIDDAGNHSVLNAGVLGVGALLNKVLGTGNSVGLLLEAELDLVTELLAVEVTVEAVSVPDEGLVGGGEVHVGDDSLGEGDLLLGAVAVLEPLGGLAGELVVVDVKVQGVAVPAVVVVTALDEHSSSGELGGGAAGKHILKL